MPRMGSRGHTSQLFLRQTPVGCNCFACECAFRDTVCVVRVRGHACKSFLRWNGVIHKMHQSNFLCLEVKEDALRPSQFAG